MLTRLPVALAAVILTASCGRVPPEPLTVAAAANLSGTFTALGKSFTDQTGIPVVFSYGATSQLAQQIENGAPFDLFAAADTAHVDALVKSRKIVAASRAVYARGRLVLWIPSGGKVEKLDGLTEPEVRFLAIAKPEAAPYGKAAVEALRRAGLWDRISSKVVYASNINTAKEMAATGNADAAFTAYSLTLQEGGRRILVDESLYTPIDQALGVVAASSRRVEAERFADFLLRGDGRKFLDRSGYSVPSQ